MRTQFILEAIESKLGYELFEYLKSNTKWEDGIRSRNGFTRKAKMISHIEMDKQMELHVQTDSKEYTNLYSVITSVLSQFKLETDYAILGIYLNYYKNGEMYTPNHNHPKTHQLVISLGETRTLNVGKKTYSSSHGSAILFGSSIHGVPKEENKKERISIAVFLLPIKE